MMKCYKRCSIIVTFHGILKRVINTGNVILSVHNILHAVCKRIIIFSVQHFDEMLTFRTNILF
jgi:hypothetical protein